MIYSVLLICAREGVTSSIEDAFRKSGYLIETVSSAIDVLEKVKYDSPDIIISELSDRIDALSLLKWIRATDSVTPFLILNMKNDEKSTIDSLEAGANDCMRMPCSEAEILVRSRNILNYTRSSKQTWKKIGRYTFEPVTNTLSIDGKTSVLPGREADILEMLSKCINRTVNTTDMLKALSIDADYFAGRSLSVHITKLRKMLSDDPDIEIINERGVGYRLVDKRLLLPLNNS